MLKNTGERLILDESWNLMTTMEHLHRYYAAANLTNGKDVLDAACGTGYGTRILAERAKSVIGVDLSQDAIEYARQKYGTDRSNLSYIQMSIDSLDFQKGSFDLITSFETIEHIYPEQQRAFLEASVHLLKENGMLLISTPNDALLREISHGNYENPYHVAEFDEDSFITFLKEYYDYIEIYYQTVTEVSGIVAKGMGRREGAIYSLADHNKMGRFYIAVCSNKPIPDTLQMDSVCLPDPRLYVDERYLTKTARVFCDVGKGFDGKNCCVSSYVSRDGRSFNCQFDLSDWPESKEYRFDPCEHGGKIKIDSVEANIPEVTVTPVNAAAHENGYDIFDTVDPIYSINVPKKQLLKWIKITGEIIEERDDLIFQKKWEQLKKAEEETKILQNTVSVRQKELKQYHDYQITLQQALVEREKQIGEYRDFQKVLQGTINEREKVIEQYKSYQNQLEQTIEQYEKQQRIQNEMIQQYQMDICQQENIIKQQETDWIQKFQILETQLQQEEEQYRILTIERDDQKKKIDEITHSVSWKITKPFRKLRRMVESKRIK